MDRRRESSSADWEVLVDARGPGEWIVRTPAGRQALHIYKLGPADWLVSEVGQGSEGRGRSLRQALGGLSGEAGSPDWWEGIPGAIEDETGRDGRVS